MAMDIDREVGIPNRNRKGVEFGPMKGASTNIGS